MTDANFGSADDRCLGPGGCRLAIGWLLIGIAVGWFMSSACSTRFDVALAAVADDLQTAGTLRELKPVQHAIGLAGAAVKLQKVLMQESVMGAILGGFGLFLVGCLFLQSGIRRLHAPCSM